MDASTNKPPLIFIVGPTASGKTDWAIQWAEHSSASILNSDSIQAYKNLKIGSAQPDFKKYPQISFHLFNMIPAPQVWTAGKFRTQALEVLKKNLPQKTVLVVGASGFYIQALEKGMYPAKVVPKNIIKNLEIQLKEKGLSHLYQLLKTKDLKTAKQISPNDSYRIFRALSLMESEGKTISQIKKEFKEEKLPWSYLKLGLKIPKEELLKRVKKRTHKMLKEGLIEEVELLLQQGFQDWMPLQSVGYKETLLYLNGKIKKENLADEIISKTMSLAKKQNKWFKRDKSIKWLDWNQSALKVYKEIFKC